MIFSKTDSICKNFFCLFNITRKMNGKSNKSLDKQLAVVVRFLMLKVLFENFPDEYYHLELQ